MEQDKIIGYSCEGCPYYILNCDGIKDSSCPYNKG